MSTSAPARKPRRWLRRIVLGVLTLLLLTVCGLFAWLQWDAVQGRKQVAAVVAQLDEDDPKWRLEDFDRPDLPDGENAMLVVLKARDAWGKWQPTDVKLPDGTNVLESDAASNRRLDEQRLAVLNKHLAALEQSVALAASLKDYRRGRSSFVLADDVLGTDLPHVQPVRQVAWLLRADGERLAHAGNLDEAAERVRATFNAGTALGEDPFLVCMLVRVALRVLAAYQIERLLALGELSDDGCQALQTTVATELKEDLLSAGLRGERALHHRLFENLQNGTLTPAEFLATDNGRRVEPSWSLRLGSFLYSFRVPEDHAAALRWQNKACALARLPPWKQLAEWDALEDELRGMKRQTLWPRRYVISSLMLSFVRKTGESSLRDQAHLACVETALACERYRLARKKWPATLAELKPAWLEELRPDPFTGEPLKYAQRDGGVVIYSVGPDGEDDGGEVLRFRGGGEKYDLGVFLHDPARRGLAAE